MEHGDVDVEPAPVFKSIAPELIERYSLELRKIVAAPELRQRLEREGFEPGSNTPAELAAYIRSEGERWGRVVRLSGTTID